MKMSRPLRIGAATLGAAAVLALPTLATTATATAASPASPVTHSSNPQDTLLGVSLTVYNESSTTFYLRKEDSSAVYKLAPYGEPARFWGWTSSGPEVVLNFSKSANFDDNLPNIRAHNNPDQGIGITMGYSPPYHGTTKTFNVGDNWRFFGDEHGVPGTFNAQRSPDTKADMFFHLWCQSVK